MCGMIICASELVQSFPVSGGGAFVAVDHVSLEIPERTLTILRGRSGSGKTTLLNMLGALDSPASGSVFLDGEEIGSMPERGRELIRR